MQKHVVIIGAGVIGLTTAYALIKAGQKVTLLEQLKEVGLATSFANGGQLSYRYVAPLADAGVPFQALQWMGKDNSPLNFHLRCSPFQWSWLLQFLMACNRNTNKINGAHILRLSLLSQNIMGQWRNSNELDDFCWFKSGKMVVYRDQKSFDKASKGIDPQFQQSLSAHDSCKIEPALKNIEHKLAGSVYSPDDETADCYKFCCALINYLKQQPNFTLRTDCPIETIEQKNDSITGVRTAQGLIEGDDYIVCAGNGSRSLLSPLGINVPIYALKGYSLTLPFPEQPHIVPTMSVTDYGNKIVYAKQGDELRMAAMVDIGYEHIDIRENRIAAIKRIAQETFPQLEGLDEAKIWSGLRPSTPKGPPILGASPNHKNLWLNVGHGSLGFTLSAGSATILTQLITNNTSPISLEGLSTR